MITVISSSLNSDSNSRILALEARRILKEDGLPVNWLDLRDAPLPLCDGESAYSDPNVARVAAAVREADAVIVATPIYNFDANAVLKNLVELTGKAWEDQVVGFLCAAGGTSSYMSIMALANSLMLDFRSLIVPRFVYATGSAFADGRIADPVIEGRVADLTRATARLGQLVRNTEPPRA